MQYQYTIDKIIGHEFTYPWNFDVNLVHENWNSTNIYPSKVFIATSAHDKKFYMFKNPKLNPINDPLKYQQKVQGTRCPTLLYYVNLFLVMYIMFKNLKYIKQFLISNFVRTICAIYQIKWIQHYHNSTDFFLFQRSYFSGGMLPAPIHSVLNRNTWKIHDRREKPR